MNLAKLLKVIEFAWPFIKEIVLDKETSSGDRRKKGILFSLLVTMVLFGGGAWSAVAPYIRPYLPPNQSSTTSQNDRDAKWVRFLENQMAEHVQHIAELDRELRAIRNDLAEAQSTNAELQRQLDALNGSDDTDERSDLFDRLENLRSSP